MDENTFTENFNNQRWPSKTFLCYMVERLDDENTATPLDEHKGFVRNKKLTTFLEENHHISLHIFASRIYTVDDSGSHQSGLRALQARAGITIMTSEDFERCWVTLVDHKEKPFQPWEGLEVKSKKLCEELQAILRAQQN
uniref:APOBEC3Z1 transcript variant 1 n=1 Tax=Ovis aries TaxID=9940 RepID=A0A0K0MJ55_SHEEP|nr:APOBEC3Z1 transcript variant 1 [Ovis aries]